MAFIYTSLPVSAQLRVGENPDVVKEWCGYNPDKYSISVFLKGIFRDVYMGTITDAKNNLTEPWLKEFLDDDPEAFLGDGFRHIEFGDLFIEKYEDVNRANESLAPVSGHHLNIITETDRTIEKWQIRNSWNRDTFATFFKDYASYSFFISKLKGKMTKAVNKALAIITKAVMLSDPSQVIFDDKDFARIFGKTRDNPTAPTPIPKGTRTPNPASPTSSQVGAEWVVLMQELAQKYYGKASMMWRNIQWYNPYHFSFDDYYEEMQKDFIFEQANVGKDRVKRQKQQLYTDPHGGEALSNAKTYKNHHLSRTDSLFALFYTVANALTIITTEESSQYWLGNDTASQATQTKEASERVRSEMTGVSGGLDGHAISDGEVAQDNSHNTTASSDGGFEVTCSLDDIVILLNPEDYTDLKNGISRRGQMDVRSVNLSQWGVAAVYPFRGTKPGFVRLIQRQAYRIKEFFSMTDFVEPSEKLTWRQKQFYQAAITIFKNFVGCLFVPSPHFTASPAFYDKYGLIGQKIEKKQ